MEIRFLGHSCFQIRGRKATVVTDPFGPSCGLKLAKVAADIVTVSHNHDDHNYIEAIGGTPRKPQPFVIKGPGEYEVAGVSIFGLPSFHDKTKGSQRGKNALYIIEMDNLKLVHLGDLGHLLDDKQLEKINGVDILFVPVGGLYTIDAKEAAELVGKIQPKIVVPMHYKAPSLTFDLAPVDDFLKELGEKKPEPIQKLTVTSDKLPEEGQTVIFNGRT